MCVGSLGVLTTLLVPVGDIWAVSGVVLMLCVLRRGLAVVCVYV